MTGLYVQLDASYAQDPKVLDLEDERSELLFVRSLAYCKLNLTDGFIHRRKLAELAPAGDADAYAADLVSVGLWVVSERGWTVPSWLKRNQSAEQVQATRDAEAARKKSWRDKKKANGTVQSGRDEPATADTDGTRQTPETEGETEGEVKPPSPRNGSKAANGHGTNGSAPAGADEFETWWQGYPHKVGKQEARQAFVKALKPPHAVTVALLTERLERQRAVWDRENRPTDKIPYAQKWLNNRRFEDDVLTEAPALNVLNPLGDRY